MTFEELKLIPPLLRALHDEGYTVPTPIQVQAIPHVLAGRDLLGLAQTGTGKTAAFALPILQRLVDRPPMKGPGQRPIRVLILTPTRELASQIGESFASYGRHLTIRHTVIFGGVGQDAQTRALRAGVDVLVATPGRLLDLMGQRLVFFDKLEVFVLDEADRMLDMGFIHDVKRVIAALPAKKQTLLLSATMPPDIQALVDSTLHDPARVAVAPVSATADRIDQSLYFVERGDKRALLVDLLASADISRALVFTRTKHGANKVAEHLSKAHIGAEAIHGNKSQGARERALAHFKNGTTRVLVATDIAARGIDIDAISHVINFDIPNVPETYVHRIGRTARAGAEGRALSFCEAEERPFLVDIERLIRQQIPVVDDHPYKSSMRAPQPGEHDRGGRRAAPPPQRSGGGRPQNRGRHEHSNPRPQRPQQSRGFGGAARGGQGGQQQHDRPAVPQQPSQPVSLPRPGAGPVNLTGAPLPPRSASRFKPRRGGW